MRRIRRRGFSLIELVVVVVIIGIIAAIAIPHLGRGAQAAADAALAQDLAQIRQAIDAFQAEHGGAYPTMGMINSALTSCTDDSGTSGQSTKDTIHTWGPYLRSIPPLPVGAAKGATLIARDTGGPVAATAGWLYDPVTGAIRANCSTETDTNGTLYSAY